MQCKSSALSNASTLDLSYILVVGTMCSRSWRYSTMRVLLAQSLASFFVNPKAEAINKPWHRLAVNSQIGKSLVRITGEEFQPSQTTFYHLDHENHFSRGLPVRVAYECRSCAPQFYCGHPIRESSRLGTSAYLNLPSIQYFHLLHRHLLLLLCVSAVTGLSVR